MTNRVPADGYQTTMKRMKRSMMNKFRFYHSIFFVRIASLDFGFTKHSCSPMRAVGKHSGTYELVTALLRCITEQTSLSQRIAYVLSVKFTEKWR